MLIYFAPMEGITKYLYRNAHHAYYPGIDRYYTPFIPTNEKVALKNREVRDVLPKNNPDIPLIPQLLSNNAHDFLEYTKFLADLGYTEVNLNAGCPSRTVVTHGRGSGILEDPDRYDRFLEAVFDGNPPIPVSIKTRLGILDASLFPELMEIYNRYPLAELIIHPRTQKDMYKPGTVNMDAFRTGLASSRCPVCYNGDLFTLEDIRNFRASFPTVDRIMVGRGLLSRPWLAAQQKGFGEPDIKVLKAFHQAVLGAYCVECSGDRQILFKMKEIWCYLGASFPDKEKELKKLRKCQTLSEYKVYVNLILQ